MPLSKMTFDEVEVLLNKSLKQFVLRPIATTVSDSVKIATIKRYIDLGIKLNSLLRLWHRDQQHIDDSISLNMKGVLAALDEFIKSEKEKHFPYLGKGVRPLENSMINQELEDHEIGMQDRYEKREKKLVLSRSENSVLASKETIASTADNDHYPSRKRLNRQDSQNLMQQEQLQQELFQQQVIFESFKKPNKTTVSDNGDGDKKHKEQKFRVNATPATLTQQEDNSASDTEGVTSEEELDIDNDNEPENLKLAKAISLSHNPSAENNGEEETLVDVAPADLQQNSAISTSSVGSTSSTMLPAQYSEGAGVVGFFPVPTNPVISDSQLTSPASSSASSPTTSSLSS
ncbi:MAG TPA: hypothetical protein VHE99_04625 [Gammaproteobacteria bacterium]|nr:hypothetical protein [Gammaproteobacteria bacterium]